MARYIALLRGINLGSTRRVSMPELRAALDELGYEDVETLVQSGNVVLTSTDGAKQVATAIERAVEERCGVTGVPIVVRTRAQWAKAIEDNPLPDGVQVPKLFQVTFCSGRPKAAAVEKIEAQDLGAEQVAFRGREVYAFHPDGMQRSKLARQLTDERLGVTATARNWNTVTKLLELADG